MRELDIMTIGAGRSRRPLRLLERNAHDGVALGTPYLNDVIVRHHSGFAMKHAPAVASLDGRVGTDEGFVGLEALLSLRTVVVTGASGVGKTTVACAFARTASELGLRVLLVELDGGGEGFSAMATALGVPGLASAPTAITPRLAAVRLGSRFSDVGPIGDALLGPMVDGATSPGTARSIVRAVPAISHADILCTWHELVQASSRDRTDGHAFDLVVLDFPTIDEASAMAKVASAFAQQMTAGTLSGRVHAALREWQDPTKTGALIVSQGEPSSVRDAIEGVATLQATGLRAAGFVVNRVPYDPLSDEEHVELRAILAALPPAIGERTLQRIERARLSWEGLDGALDLPATRLYEVWLDGPKLVAELATSLDGELRP